MHADKNETASKVTGILIIVFIGLIMIFSNINIREVVHSKIGVREKALKEIEVCKIQDMEEGSIALYESWIAHFTKNQLIGYNFEGVSLWNMSIPSENTKVYLGEKEIYILEKELGVITSIDHEGNKSWTYETRQEVENLVDKGKYVFLLSKTESSINQVNILDDQGRTVVNKDIENGMFLTGNISNDESRFAIAILDLSKGDIDSKVTVYSKDGKVIWEELFYEELVLDIGFLHNGTAVVSDKKIYLFSDEKEILWSRELEGNILDVEIEKNNLVLLYDREGCHLEAINPSGKTIMISKFPKEYSEVKINNNDFYVISKNSILGIRDEKQFLDYRSKKEIKHMRILADKVLIATTDEIKKMKLVNSRE